MSDHTNREAWLTRAVEEFALPLIKERTHLSPVKPIKISVGFPAGGGRKRKNGSFTTGQCCMTNENKYQHIFIHPARDDRHVEGRSGVLETVLHECLHACLPMHVGHRREFSRPAKQLGILPKDAKPTSTLLDEEMGMVTLMKEWHEALGEYPHESLEVTGKTQTTRLLKVMCPTCGYVARVTLKWLDEAGAPLCPQCGCSFEEAGTGEQAQSPLYAESQTVFYNVKPSIEYIKAELARQRQMGKQQPVAPKYDPRYKVQMLRRGNVISWRVFDYGPATITITLADGSEKEVAVLGDILDPETGQRVYPRHGAAENRVDALSVVEALQDGSMTWEEFTADDNDPELDVDPDSEYEDEDETLDGDPFTDEEMEEYEREMHEREQGRPKVEVQPAPSFEERVKQLERLF